MATSSQKSAEKWKTKQWFNVHTPKVLGGEVVGEIPALDEKAVLGRVIKVSMAWITKNPSQSFMTVGLKVNDANGNSANTSLNYIEQVYSYTHSLVRRGSSIIYTNTKVKDSEGKPFVLKLLAITRHKVAGPKKTLMRKALDTMCTEYVAQKSQDDFVKSVIDGSFQAEGKKVANKIATVGKLEVRKIEF